MKKLIIISENEKRSLLFRAMEWVFDTRNIYCCSGTDAEKIINDEKPDLVYVDTLKPVNGEDCMNTLRLLDGNVRLRVAIFNLRSKKKRPYIFKPVSNHGRLIRAAN